MIHSPRILHTTGTSLAVLAGLALLGVQAQADLQFTSPSISGNLFTYDLNFSNSIDGTTLQPNQRLELGDFATLYDISGLNSFTLNPAFTSLFTISQQNVGVTPSGVAPTDNPALPNLTLTYIGPTTTTDQSFSQILTVNSSFTTVNPLGQYTGETTKNSGVADGSAVGAIGFVAVPGVDITTPEPGSLALLVGASLSGSVFALRRRRK